jgi:hypothetical protein
MTKQIQKVLITALAVAATVSQRPAAAAEGRIVAVGDVHGAYDQLVAILQRAELIDAETHWIGGSATFVQTGDLFDRGLQVFEVMDLLMRLQDEATAAGGKVIVLLGNHEGMNLIGFFRDVNPDIYARFVDKRSEKRRKQGLKGFVNYFEQRAAAAGTAPPMITDELKAQWMALYPPGRIEYEEAIGPEGRYGRWLRTLPVAVIEGGTLFIHAGLSPAVEGMSIDEINAEVATELAAYDRTRQYMSDAGLIPPFVGLVDMMAVYRKLEQPAPELASLAVADGWLIHSSDGPLWFRGAAATDDDMGKAALVDEEPGAPSPDEAADATPEEEAEGAHADTEAPRARLVELLHAVGAERMVGGHTPQSPRRIQTRLDGRVILIDTGMLASVYEGGRPSALVIEGGSFTALYLDGEEKLEVDEALPAAA